MCEYAEILTVSPSSITQDNIDVLRDVGWRDEDIVDIVHITGLFNYLDRIADGLGIEIEPHKQETSEKLSFTKEVPEKRYGTISKAPANQPS